MYVQITTRCNMTCKHCCYACTSRGKDMTLEIFKAAVATLSSVSIGGGEPTLHPQFWEMLRHCMANPDLEYVWLATNGSKTEDALALAKLARHGVIGVALSQDPWHDPIDPKVVKAFTRGKPAMFGDRNDNDSREVRSTQNPIDAGRCDFGTQGCVCSDLFMEPSGRIRFCGCKDSPVVGHVLTGIRKKYQDCDFLDQGECYRNIEALNAPRLRRSA